MSLRPESDEQWTQGTPAEALEPVRTCEDELAVDRSAEPWFKRKSADTGALL